MSKTDVDGSIHDFCIQEGLFFQLEQNVDVMCSFLAFLVDKVRIYRPWNSVHNDCVDWVVWKQNFSPQIQACGDLNTDHWILMEIHFFVNVAKLYSRYQTLCTRVF